MVEYLRDCGVSDSALSIPVELSVTYPRRVKLSKGAGGNLRNNVDDG